MKVWTRVDLTPLQDAELDLGLKQFSEKYGGLSHNAAHRLCLKRRCAPKDLGDIPLKELILLDAEWGEVERWACRWIAELGPFRPLSELPPARRGLA